MSREQNLATQERLGAAVYDGNLDALTEVFVPWVIERWGSGDELGMLRQLGIGGPV